MQHLREDLAAAAHCDAKVLIVGETGTGKEVVARLIHETSRRRTRDFVTVNCAGIPDSLLESELFGHVRGSFTGAYRDKSGLAAAADRGTLFLDELGEMSLRMQALLLRFLETGEVQRVGSDRVDGRLDVRVIAATNRDLHARIGSREFREDLYYRLNVLKLAMPPLRERGEDIGILVEHYLTEAARIHGLVEARLSPAAHDALTQYRWPGNVRELKNVLERIVVRHRSNREIGPDDLPREILTAPSQESTALPSDTPTTSRCDRLWHRMVVQRESFWTAVYPAFIDRDLTRADLRYLVKAGLQQTQGSYRRLVDLFGMGPGDYKRFLAFLYQHNCHLPFQAFREGRSDESARRSQTG
jgi:transcriptional regulator with PAS, ATPase and Fis domain